MFRTLWVKRRKNFPNFKSKLKCWVKRVFLLNQLLLNELRIFYIRAKGGKVSSNIYIKSLKIEGRYSNLEICDGVFIGNNVFIQLHNKVIISRNSVINDDVKIITGSHDIDSKSWDLITSPILIGEYCWIATNSLILPGANLDNYSVIGAGSVVKKQIKEYAVVAGNPAKFIRLRNIERLEHSPVEFTALFDAWCR